MQPRSVERIDSVRRGRRGRRPYQELERLESRRLLSSARVPIPGEILVAYRPGVREADRAAFRAPWGLGLEESILEPGILGASTLERVTIPAGHDANSILTQIKSDARIEFAQPNYQYTTQATSNDPYYLSGSLWGMYGDATTPANAFGSQAGEAWAAGDVGSNTVYIGIIDEGIDHNHPDLAANIWVNPDEVPGDGKDNDGNGFIDDIHGFDFYHNDGSTFDPADGDDHGTHVAGIIGAVGGNGVGIAGVAWNVKLISAKFLGPSGGSTAGAVKALDYLTNLKRTKGLNIVATNNSWGGGGHDPALLAAITRAANENILFIAAAGNGGADNVGDNNDVSPSYPSSYNTTSGAGYDAVISVASITNTGVRSSFSNYGATSVDLGAPGTAILSTLPGNRYGAYSGTSMATPHVTGAAALYAAKYPGATAEQIRNALLSTTTPTASLANRTVTGGRLNVSAALAFAAEPPLPPPPPPPPPPTLPKLSISDVRLDEGNSGNTTFTFTVTLSAASASTVKVNFATADNTATTSNNDYLAASGTLSFAPGTLTRTISVTVIGDSFRESDEAFFVNLSGASGATISDAQGVGTIVNDDLRKTLGGTPGGLAVAGADRAEVIPDVALLVPDVALVDAALTDLLEVGLKLIGRKKE